MLSKDNEPMIVKLAMLLSVKEVDSKIIKTSLNLICTNFSFDCGLVYEIDQYNQLNLKEQFIVNPLPIKPNFVVDELSAEYRTYLAQDKISYIRNDPHHSKCEQEVLRFFAANSLVAYSVVDDDKRIAGIMLFLNANSHNIFAESELQAMAVALPMLSRYVGIRMYHNKLSFAKVSLESMLDNTGIDIYVNDFHTHEILYVNKSMADPYGGVSAFTGNKCWQVLFPGQQGSCEFCPQKKLLDEHGEPSKVYSWDYQRAFDGSWFRVFSSAFRWVDGRLAHVVSSADITDNKRNEELIQYMANYDQLTKLPNRRMLVQECERRIDNAKENYKGYILFFDIDGFKAINDELGHDAGDEFLVNLGQFFSGIPMLKNSIYRNGGDEFVAILDCAITDSHINSLAHFINERFKKPWMLKKGSVFCNVSIGVSCYPEDGNTANELLQKADQAMYAVKKSGGAGLRFAAASRHV